MFRRLKSSVIVLALTPSVTFSQETSLTVLGDGVYEMKGDRGVFGYILDAAEKEIVMFQPCDGTPRAIEKAKLRKTSAKCGDDAPPNMHPLKVSCEEQESTWQKAAAEIERLPANEMMVGKVWALDTKSPSAVIKQSWEDVMAQASKSVGVGYCGNIPVVVSKEGEALMKIIDAQLK
ncbi:hypothetical protein [Sinorhizobium medicae]|uniref:hypothetical protein n=1 Tax=Sinorhizobium medicae TaxID=110321 RepID=UPI000C7C5328|nr:hypothetical protein [Sinorhizobium medicae]MDX1149781.1 hypothetical protein [Sinorhizobium medicae]PLU43218.1 hypothetical protein BMJ26_02815 [Sinorhizobium medicae]